MYYRLVRINLAKGAEAQAWILQLPSAIGRGSDLAVCIDDESISRSHCQLLLGPDEGLMVRDLGSLNGTYVNGERVRQMHSLVPGDELQIGSVTLRVEYTSDTDPGPLSPKKSKVSMETTQPMKTLSSPGFTMEEVKEVPKKWWEFWKGE